MSVLLATLPVLSSTAGSSAAAASSIPAWMTTAAPIVGALGTDLAAIGQISQARSQENVMEANAELAEQQARQEQEAGKLEAWKLSKERRRVLGTQRAVLGAAGVAAEGSPLDVMAETAAEFERDIRMTGYNADIRANRLYGEAASYRYGAASRRNAGWIGAGSTLLTGYGRSLLGKY